MVENELGDTKEIRPLVATSAYFAMSAEIEIKLVSLLHSCLRVKLAQIELSQNDEGHSSVESL